MSNKRFIIQRFRFPKILTCQGYFTIRAAGGMRRVQISCDICIRFARYLYSTKLCWIIIDDIPQFSNFSFNSILSAGRIAATFKKFERQSPKMSGNVCLRAKGPIRPELIPVSVA